MNSSNKGFLPPRLSLQSPIYQLSTATNTTDLLVYYVGTNMSFGYYYWDGTNWLSLVAEFTIPALISNLSSGSADLMPSSNSVGNFYSGYLTIPYIGGKGGVYSGGTSLNVNDLTFRLVLGVLANSYGELVFSVTGMPNTSSLL